MIFSFLALERINDNAYNIDLPSEYGVSTSFNVIDLSSCDVDVLGAHTRTDSSQDGGDDRGLSQEHNPRITSFQEGGDDRGLSKENKDLEALHQLKGPMTRSKAQT